MSDSNVTMKDNSQKVLNELSTGVKAALEAIGMTAEAHAKQRSRG